jgi:hypothetical protein
MRIIALSAILLLVTQVHAEEALNTWQVLPGMTSAQLASSDGWELASSSGLSWPDGRQALVTFWKGPKQNYLRCVTYFDASMGSTGEGCYRAPITK